MKVTKELTDKIFNTITANECREMSKDRFFQACKELLTILEKTT